MAETCRKPDTLGMDNGIHIYGIGFFDEATSDQIANRYGEERIAVGLGAHRDVAIARVAAAFPALDAAKVRQFIDARYGYVDTTMLLASTRV